MKKSMWNILRTLNLKTIGVWILSLLLLSACLPDYSENGRALLSVTVLESELSERELVSEVQNELQAITGINAAYFQLEKVYHIPYALPQVDDPKYSIPFTECRITENVFLAGDYLLNGSINAAMTSGRIAAEAVIHSFVPTY